MGIVTLCGKQEILAGGFLACAFLSYAFLFWLDRVLVDFFYFNHKDRPSETIFFIGHVCLTTLFLMLVTGFGIPLFVLLKGA